MSLLGDRTENRASQRGVVLHDNWGNVITGDIHGNVVLANGQPFALTLHIPFIEDPVPDNVGSLLNWRCRIPRQLYGRDAEMAELRRWCAEPAKVRIRILHGEGGAGKSRMAFELATQLHEQGWSAGQLESPDQAVAFPLGEQGLLLIIDYPEQYPDALEKLLKKLKNIQWQGAKLRLLLLARNGEALHKVASRHVEPLLSQPILLNPISAEHSAWSLFQAGLTHMARLRSLPPPQTLDQQTFENWLKRDNAHRQPLIILGFAVNLIDDPRATSLNRAEIVERLTEREISRIEAEAKAHNLQAEGVLLLKALAALSGGFRTTQIDSLRDLLKVETDRADLRLPSARELKQTGLWQNNMLPPFQPDLLASALTHSVISRAFSDPSKIAGKFIWATISCDDPNTSLLCSRFQLIAKINSDLIPTSGTKLRILDVLTHFSLNSPEIHTEVIACLRKLSDLSEEFSKVGKKSEGDEMIRCVEQFRESFSVHELSIYSPNLLSRPFKKNTDNTLNHND